MTAIRDVTEDDLRFIRKFPDKCCAEVSRRGTSEPCDLVAVAVAYSHEAYDPSWWPVCKKHARGRELVPLQDVIRYLTVASEPPKPHRFGLPDGFIGPRCCYCGHSVQNPGDECGMCAGSKAAQTRRGGSGVAR